MLTKLTVRNFKRFGEVEIELGNPVVFIGPNNSGKTSAMQALALWDIGLKRWVEKREGSHTPKKRPGVTVNRRDLVAIPHPSAKHMWRDLRVQDPRQVDGKTRTSSIKIEVLVEGVEKNSAWECGLEFYYANEESFYCRPLPLDDSQQPVRVPIPPETSNVRITFLPPMSGLVTNETRLDQGAVNVRIGEGRTAEVLRNLCYRILEQDREQETKRWASLVRQIEALFGVRLNEPRYVAERGEITLGYEEHGKTLDLSSSGRGLQQTLLILAYMHANPQSAVLLDEPDAHLEILRQRQIYRLVSEVASANDNQIIAASHSEVLLNEAADRDMVIAFVGRPHRMGSSSQVCKALAKIGFDQYYQAELSGWVLYLEGSTDLAILQAFAKRLEMEGAVRALERPFVHYVGNSPPAAAEHFRALKEALPELKGIVLFDRLDRPPHPNPSLDQLVWKRREIENYICSPATLDAYASATAKAAELGPLFTPTEIERRKNAMEKATEDIEQALDALDRGSPWDAEFKVSDEFLTPLFQRYFENIGIPNLMSKKNFYELAEHVPDEEIDPEIGEKLNSIAAVAERASPASAG